MMLDKQVLLLRLTLQTLLKEHILCLTKQLEH